MFVHLTQSGYRYPFAYVAFGGHRTQWWMRFLKKGFCHCFLILGNGSEWIIIDPLIHFTDLIILKNVQIIPKLRAHGYRIVQTTPAMPDTPRLSIRPYTCVETVKRFLGIKKRFLFTPYQLFCYFLHK